MRSMSIFGYVAIVIVSLIAGVGIFGFGLYYLCRYLKSKREGDGVVPLPIPEKNENLKQEVSFILPNKSLQHHPDDNLFLDVVQSFQMNNGDISHISKGKMLEISRDRANISKNS